MMASASQVDALKAEVKVAVNAVSVVAVATTAVAIALRAASHRPLAARPTVLTPRTPPSSMAWTRPATRWYRSLPPTFRFAPARRKKARTVSPANAAAVTVMAAIAVNAASATSSPLRAARRLAMLSLQSQIRLKSSKNGRLQLLNL